MTAAHLCDFRGCRRPLDPVSVAEHGARFCSHVCRSKEHRARRRDEIAETYNALVDELGGIFTAAAVAGIEDVETRTVRAETHLGKLAKLASLR